MITTAFSVSIFGSNPFCVDYIEVHIGSQNILRFDVQPSLQYVCCWLLLRFVAGNIAEGQQGCGCPLTSPASITIDIHYVIAAPAGTLTS